MSNSNNFPTRTNWVNSQTPNLYYGQPRNIYAPAAMYGNMPGASVADLGRPEAITTWLTVNINAATAGTVNTDIFSSGSNGIDVITEFTDATTSCSIDVINNDTSTTLVTFTNVTKNSSASLMVNYITNRIILNGANLKFKVYNMTGSGLISIGYKVQ